MHEKQHKPRSFLPALALVAACCATAQPAAAEGLRPSGYFVSAGAWENSVLDAGVGLTWPWAWKASLLGTEVGGVTEGSLSHWSARAAGERRSYTQLALVPVLRFRFAAGHSPWFAEAGIGVSTMDRKFSADGKQFSTLFNFVDVIGLGRNFGAAGAQEVSLRLQHVSNGGIRNPNPGQDFVQLRYARAF